MKSNLLDILTPERVIITMNVNSKKRLLEEVANIFCSSDASLDRDTIFQIFFERERLGSTGIGNHVALPHGRVSGLKRPLGMLATLKSPLDFDSIDKQPVELIFGLLVPADASEEHLNLLAQLAKMFSHEDLVEKLVNADSTDSITSILGEWWNTAEQRLAG